MKKISYISPEVEAMVLEGECGVCQTSKNDEYNQIPGGSWDE